MNLSLFIYELIKLNIYINNFIKIIKKLYVNYRNFIITLLIFI